MDIVLDYDGTCVAHSFPHIGKDIGAVPVLKRLIAAGHNLILFTMRSDGEVEQVVNGYRYHAGDYLQQAIDWFKSHDIPLYGIQRNPTQDKWTKSPKAYGQLFIDDAALGCPLRGDPTISDRLFADWKIIEEMLEEKELI